MHRRRLLGLLGGAVAAPALAGLSPDRLLAAARRAHSRAYRRPRRILDAAQAETVATIAELIIPETDTPGARAAGVPEFIDLIVAEWYDPDERERFLEGLAGVDARSRTTFGAEFTELDPTQQVALLRGLDAEVTALREADGEAGEHFFQQIKWLTLYGYYTSEVGLTRELHYQIVPGRYDPCAATGIPSPEGD